jgi:hypothetical protein
MWNDSTLQISYPQLFCYTTNKNIIVKSVLELEALDELFHLPLSVESYQHLCEMEIIIKSIQQSNGKDRWSYISCNFGY